MMPSTPCRASMHRTTVDHGTTVDHRTPVDAPRNHMNRAGACAAQERAARACVR
jgi:hypothetical protein